MKSSPTEVDVEESRKTIWETLRISKESGNSPEWTSDNPRAMATNLKHRRSRTEAWRIPEDRISRFHWRHLRCRHHVSTTMTTKTTTTTTTTNGPTRGLWCHPFRWFYRSRRPHVFPPIFKWDTFGSDRCFGWLVFYWLFLCRSVVWFKCEHQWSYSVLFTIAMGIFKSVQFHQSRIESLDVQPIWFEA